MKKLTIDKLHHLVYGGFIYLLILHLTNINELYALLITFLVALAKDFVWDGMLKKGHLDLVDLLSTMVVPVVLIVLNK